MLRIVIAKKEPDDVVVGAVGVVQVVGVVGCVPNSIMEIILPQIKGAMLISLYGELKKYDNLFLI